MNTCQIFLPQKILESKISNPKNPSIIPDKILSTPLPLPPPPPTPDVDINFGVLFGVNDVTRKWFMPKSQTESRIAQM